MAGDVQDIIHAASDPVVAVQVPAAAVSGEIETGELAEIGIGEPFVVAVNRARLAGPRAGEAKVASVVKSGGFSSVHRATQGPFNMIIEARP